MRSRFLNVLALLAAAVCLHPGALWALGIRLPDQDARATARGEAFAATADNPSAIYYNPAGITQLEGHHFRLGAMGIYHYTEYRGMLGNAESEDREAVTPQFYYAYAAEKSPVALGFGMYSPYGLSISWPDDPTRMDLADVARQGSLTYLTFNPVIAYKVCPTLSVAAGPTINYGETKLTLGLPSPLLRGRFKGDDIVPGFNAGLLWKPHVKHAFGINYRSATSMNFQGDASFAGTGSSASSSARFDFPQNVVLGYSFRPTPAWNLEFNADWTDWETLDTVKLKVSDMGTLPLPFNWQQSWFFEWGATRQLPHDLALSAGYIYSMNSVPEKYFMPLVPDSDRHIWSVGLGQTWKRVSWDVVYQFAYGPERTVNSSVYGANGRYTSYSHAITISIGLAL